MLRNKLTRLSAAGRATAAGRLTALQGADLFVLFLRKVDDIVLARRLVLTVPGRPELSCFVANRAVVEFGMANGELAALDVQDTEGLAQFCAHLRQFFEGHAEVAFRIERPPRDMHAFSGGVTADFLARSCGEVLYPVTERDKPREVAQFLEHNRQKISAWCRRQGDIVESGGNPTEFEKIQGFLDEMKAEFLGHEQRLVDGPASDFLFVTSAAATGSDSLFFSRHGDVQLAFAAPEEAVAALSADWQARCPAMDGLTGLRAN
ncbi:hypothetical protein [Aliiruegeria lutimaris]|uniref:Uncharacterized protein n=1 Tax=Aliiruegeria lutimaris TaxID=571298 RepID=A0A1G8VEX2_9RHOB|nr:hypothetical protein [Aliiruegeria lutimaris]SDJ64593.1 hypothetical protein SAMN04488026_102128 [Aliiruegeria lutimaris]